MIFFETLNRSVVYSIKPESSKVLLEAGCGVGNLFYPLLEEIPNLFIHACDFSKRAVQFVKVGYKLSLETISNCYSNSLHDAHIWYGHSYYPLSVPVIYVGSKNLCEVDQGLKNVTPWLPLTIILSLAPKISGLVTNVTTNFLC